MMARAAGDLGSLVSLSTRLAGGRRQISRSATGGMATGSTGAGRQLIDLPRSQLAQPTRRSLFSRGFSVIRSHRRAGSIESAEEPEISAIREHVESATKSVFFVV